MQLTQQTKEWIYMAVTLTAIFILFVIRNYGMFPSVMPDEYTHSKFSRLMALDEVKISGHLYYLVYSFTSLWGDKFVEAARILNALFYVLGGIFIFLVARSYTDFKMSWLITVFSLAMPMNLYLSYFMPEAMYFGVFWGLQHVVVTANTEKTTGWIIPGVVLALLALVKPHAVFMIPVYLVYILVVVKGIKTGILGLSTFMGSFVVARFGLGFLLAGRNGLALFGSEYARHATEATSSLAMLLGEVPNVLINILAHASLLSFLFSVAAVVLLGFILHTRNESEFKLNLLLLLHLLVLVPVVSVFAVSTAFMDENVDYRIYTRYYSFVFPFFLVVLAYFINSKHHNSFNKTAIFSFILVTLCTLALLYYYFLNEHFYPFAIVIVDLPELFHILLVNPLLLLVGGLTLLALALFALRPLQGARLYMFAVLPFFLAASWYSDLTTNTLRHQERDIDIVGMYIRDHLPVSSQDSLIVVAYMKYRADVVLMYSESIHARHYVVMPGESFNPGQLGDGIQYILTTDSLDLSQFGDEMWRHKHMQLYKLRN